MIVKILFPQIEFTWSSDIKYIWSTTNIPKTLTINITMKASFMVSDVRESNGIAGREQCVALSA